MPESTSPSPAFSARAVSLLCARLCHDLISPVSAVNHGAELLQELGAAEAESAGAPTLIGDSAARAADRLQLQRIAFGAVAERGATTAAEMLALAARCMPQAIAFEPGADSPARLDALGGAAVKLAANALAVAAELVGGRGTVALTAERDGLAVTASGSRARLDPDWQAALAGTLADDALGPETVLGHHLAVQAAAHGWRLTAADRPEGGATLSLAA